METKAPTKAPEVKNLCYYRGILGLVGGVVPKGGECGNLWPTSAI